MFIRPSQAWVTLNVGDEDFVEIFFTWSIEPYRCTIAVTKSSTISPLLTEEIVRTHAHAVGRFCALTRTDNGKTAVPAWTIEFDRTPNFTQMAMFIEQCFSELLSVK